MNPLPPAMTIRFEGTGPFLLRRPGSLQNKPRGHVSCSPPRVGAQVNDASDTMRNGHARFGIVVGRGGGALAQMARPFRMHVGGPIGSGKQMISWVHVDDVAGLVMFAIDNDALKGPLNVVSPNPVNMDQFAEGIGVILNRRSYLRVPEEAVRALFGEGAEPLLTGQKVLPLAAEKLGYEFEYVDLLPALESALGPD